MHTAQAQTATKDEQQLLTMTRTFADAIVKGTADSYFDSIATPAYIFTFANGKLNDRKTHLATFAKNTNRYNPIELSEIQVVVESNAAIVSTLRIISGMRQDASTFIFKHRYTDFYVKQGDHWKLMAQTQSVLPQE